jgi:hypothetical protein
MNKLIQLCIPFILLALAFIPSNAQNVSISLIPINPPITIPDSGGSFTYLIHAQNFGINTIEADIWLKMKLIPEGPWIGPLLLQSHTLGGGANVTRYYNQSISDTLLGGSYIFQGYIGVYPDTIWSRSSFPFEISTPSGTPIWTNRYISNCSQPFSKPNIFLKLDSDNNIYVGGGSNHIVKYSSYGMQLMNIFAQRGYIYDFEIDNSQNVYTTGGYNNSMFTRKYNSIGAFQWGQIFDQCIYGLSIALDSQGNVIVAGYDSGQYGDFVVIKYNQNGAIVWIRRYTATNTSNDKPVKVCVDSFDNIYVMGNSDVNFAIVKYNAQGDRLWADVYAQGWTINAGTLDDEGNTYLTGCSCNTITGFDYLTVEYNSDGVLVQTMEYNNGWNGYDEAIAIYIGLNGYIYVTGLSEGNHGEYDWDIVTIKYSPNGVPVWTARYDGFPNYLDDRGYAVIADNLGSIYITGYSDDGDTIRYITIKYQNTTYPVWVQREEEGIATSIALDGFQNIYVTGKSGPSYCTIKYSNCGWFESDDFASINPELPEPTFFKLSQNYPNPFNPTTTISYELPVAGVVNLSVYDTAGRQVATLVNGFRQAGAHKVTFDGSGLASGLYLCRMEAGEYTAVQKMVLLK